MRGAFWSGHVTQEKKLSLPEYCQLLEPAVEWILACLGQYADKDMCMAALREYAALAQPAEGEAEAPGAALVLAGILRNFKVQSPCSVGVPLRGVGGRVVSAGACVWEGGAVPSQLRPARALPRPPLRAACARCPALTACIDNPRPG